MRDERHGDGPAGVELSPADAKPFLVWTPEAHRVFRFDVGEPAPADDPESVAFSIRDVCRIAESLWETTRPDLVLVLVEAELGMSEELEALTARCEDLVAQEVVRDGDEVIAAAVSAARWLSLRTLLEELWGVCSSLFATFEETGHPPPSSERFRGRRGYLIEPTALAGLGMYFGEPDLMITAVQSMRSDRFLKRLGANRACAEGRYGHDES